MTVAPSRSYDRSDWASSFGNVEEEPTDVALTFCVARCRPSSKELYRNGPGRLERAGHRVHHPFDGDGMIAAMRFENGSVQLTNRFVRTEGWLAEEKAGKVLYRGVLQPEARWSSGQCLRSASEEHCYHQRGAPWRSAAALGGCGTMRSIPAAWKPGVSLGSMVC